MATITDDDSKSAKIGDSVDALGVNAVAAGDADSSAVVEAEGSGRDEADKEKKEDAEGQLKRKRPEGEAAAAVEGGQKKVPSASVFDAHVSAKSPFATLAISEDKDKGTKNVFESYASTKSPFATTIVGGPSPFAQTSSNGGGTVFSGHASTGSAFGALAKQNSGSTGFGQSSSSSETADGDGETPLGEAVQPPEAAKTDLFTSTGNETVFGSGEREDRTNNEVLLTGEEDENCVFKVRTKLYRLCDVKPKEPKQDHVSAPTFDKSKPPPETKEKDEQATKATAAFPKEYREMGVGLLHINVPRKIDSSSKDNSSGGKTEPEPPRMVMRREGVYKLLLNAVMWKTMPVERASNKAIRLVCNSVIDEASSDTSSLETFLLKLPRVDQCDELYNELISARNMC
mmetsp:Transcript_8362/g.13542  ORF Transcript_8362/g.13542 Transcript_8362/m.13542 type:complete len:401 (-) Transcript_8362:393-1595(-)|eukprot:CAMPEP_0203761810 /NCGR_PEP_ID=MMETSP0098-20131031/14825_1 /ASSEMBLY_ACC=CAM_ASM_000208 /TAXON_ID=96639 /ORGANISM=" , Strain NY0313808BC1" /LENGTH=400 /DNA_ID=CAMNT_0050655959 /DNA_START=37 /DNA_END=1239 /DNA_ORIENTATION=-